jgi:peptidyl-prolyl cis-trans isomerase D
MAKTAARKASNFFVWIILGLLFIALAGFGIGSFSGSASRLGAVGDVEITANDYARAVQNEIRARIGETGQPVNLATLRAEGIDTAILQGLVARTALANEARQIGLSVGDAAVAEQIRQIPNFQGIDGSFDREAYNFTLRQEGLSVPEFEARVREDTARGLLQAAVISGLEPPAIFAETLVAFQGETRDFSLVTITEADLPQPLPDPTDAELEAHYTANAAFFTRPEARAITYVWVTPTMIMDEMDIDEDALRALYNDRAEQFVQPERRLVERLVFADTQAAATARAAIDAGETDFDTLVADRGLSLDDVDMGDVARDDLSAEASTAVFADDAPEIVGPVDSNLGPALFRINAVLEASEVTFEDARNDLSSELAAESARRTIDGIREDTDDLLASGATLEELADETILNLGQVQLAPGVDADIAAYDNFRDAALAAAAGDFPELLTLSDGGLFALRLDAVIPPALPPLADIRDAVAASWRAGILREALAARAQVLVGELAQSGNLADLGSVAQERLIRRQDRIPGAPATMVVQMFQQDGLGDTLVIPGPDAAYIARLDAINPAARDAPDVSLLLQFVDATVAQSLAQDVFEAYGQALQAEAGIELNQGVINAVNAGFP